MKNIATATITDPTAVTAYCSARGWVSHPGAILCTIPELGYLGGDLIYCRYGLSVPYLRIQDGWRVLVEPTVGDFERWFYTGLVDGGGGVTIDTNAQLILQLLSQVLYASTAGTLHLSKQTAAESFVLGNKFLTWLQNFITNVFNIHTHPAPGGTTSPPNQAGSAPTDILSVKIFGE